MRETPREVQIWEIIQKGLQDRIGIEADEYEYAGWQFQYGVCAAKDLNAARKCYERAIQKGSHKAMLCMANMDLQDGDIEGYYHWILEAAMTGDEPMAYLKLGEMYYEGNFVRQDFAKAFRYFELAAEDDAEGAYYYLGLYAEQGISKEVDLEKAVSYFRLGAKQYDERCWQKLKDLGAKF